jgi:hypothetical protein
MSCKVWKHLWVFDCSKQDVHDRLKVDECIRMPARCGFGMLPIVQADGDCHRDEARLKGPRFPG